MVGATCGGFRAVRPLADPVATHTPGSVNRSRAEQANSDWGNGQGVETKTADRCESTSRRKSLGHTQVRRKPPGLLGVRLLPSGAVRAAALTLALLVSAVTPGAARAEADAERRAL